MGLLLGRASRRVADRRLVGGRSSGSTTTSLDPSGEKGHINIHNLLDGNRNGLGLGSLNDQAVNGLVSDPDLAGAVGLFLGWVQQVDTMFCQGHASSGSKQIFFLARRAWRSRRSD